MNKYTSSKGHKGLARAGLLWKMKVSASKLTLINKRFMLSNPLPRHVVANGKKPQNDI